MVIWYAVERDGRGNRVEEGGAGMEVVVGGFETAGFVVQVWCGEEWYDIIWFDVVSTSGGGVGVA